MTLGGAVLTNIEGNVLRSNDHDMRIREEVRTGKCQHRGSVTGLLGLPDSQEDVGEWEDYPEVHRPASWDIDDDGRPDKWEKAHSLNPNDTSDGNDDRDNDGSTNLEKHLGTLAGELAHDQQSHRQASGATLNS